MQVPMDHNAKNPFCIFFYAAVATLIGFAFLIEIVQGGCPVP